MPQQVLQVCSTDTEPILSSSAQDRLWIRQTLDGDPKTYAHLVHKYKNQLFDLTCRVLKDRCQGEDILQDAFLKAYKHLKSFRHDAQFSTWIYAIVMNGLRNHLRRNKIVRWSSLDAERMGQNDTYVPEFPHKEPSIETTIERKMDIEAVQRALPSLPLSYRSIFIMHYFQNLSLREIAVRLGRPLGTTKVYLHRSRKLLYNALKMGPTPPVRTMELVG